MKSCLETLRCEAFFSGLRVVAFFGFGLHRPLVSLEFEWTILALTSDTFMFTVFALWLELSLLKSPKHLFNRVIVLIPYKRPCKKVCHVHTHTHTVPAESLLCCLRHLNLSHWWLPLRLYTITSNSISSDKRQHTLESSYRAFDHSFSCPEYIHDESILESHTV